MRKYSDLEYLKLPKHKRLLYKIAVFFTSIPTKIKNFGLKVYNYIKKIVLGIKDFFVNIVMTFIKGDYKTKISYVIMGFGNITRGQIIRGVFFFVFEAIFIFYMITTGGKWLSLLPSLGLQGPEEVYDETLDTFVTVYHDNSFKILLYGVLTLFFVIAFIYTWYINIKQNRIAEQILATGKKIKSDKDDLHSMVDDQFHKTLLALPITGIVIFTVFPMVFMILVAFTNYSAEFNGFSKLFTWVGWENFNKLFTFGTGVNSLSATFGEVLTWTLIWAFFATFSNYFLGMLVAIMINKKGIRFKKLWRTVLVMTIAIPQFISLLYVSKMFSKSGLVNGMLQSLGWIDTAIPFWENKTLARVMVIVINIWIGIPYLMLIASGILMNIPQDLYESAKIDGANAFKQYTKITLPYMLFVTGPYLLTSFISNMNNFNVIYLLTTGNPTNPNATSSAGSVGFTDLLVTWLFKITTGAESQYYLASVIGIMIFIVVSVISLIVYSLMPSTRNEEDFQ
ncbi:MAG: sugar ABC transporter permease [Erysipelotrichaceae bacterium]|nr:sugar ABC transporter permease [Erysipelotrichaceae bacterium]